MNEFFSKGYLEGSIGKDEADRLLGIVKRQSFSEGGKYKENDLLSPPEVVTKAPDYLLQECSEWKSYSALEGFQELFGPFSYWFCTVNKFRGGRGMMWHNDHMDASFMTVLIYLTEENWEASFGGCLEIGFINNASRMIEPRLSSKEDHLVTVQGSIIPKHGSTVVLNNLTLPFCHRVTPTISNKTRYTLMFHFGYWENTKNARRDFGFSGFEGRSIVEGS